MTNLRWWYYTVETGWNGRHGPWGPVQAKDEEEAERKAAAWARTAGRTLARIEPVREEARRRL